MRGRAALTLVVWLAVVGCGAAPSARVQSGPSSAPSGTASPSTSAGPTTGTGAPGGQRPGGGSGGRGTAPGGAGAGTGSRPPVPGGAPGAGPGAAAGNPDDGYPGDMSRAFLRPAPYSRVTLELDVAGSAAPSGAVTSNLLGVLGRETAKPVGQGGGHAFGGRGSGCWSDADIQQATAQQRRVHTGGSTAALFVMFLDGAYCRDGNVLGLSYGASAMLIFTQAVQNLATPTVSADQFMKSVTVHELGHVLGMVNIGYNSTIDHEDAAHPHHSTNRNSVMYYAIDQGNLLQQFVSGPPQSYDASDEADLQGLRNGTY